MREGYWINYETGNVFPIDEHETWVRNKTNAKKLGIPASTFKQFPKFKVVDDREAFLIFLMKEAPVMRVRGHGIDTTFEYYNRQCGDALEAIRQFARENGGPFSSLNIHNLATGEATSMVQHEFMDLIDQGCQEIVRASCKYGQNDRRIVRDLLKAAKDLLRQK
jgi:hypothetical protein